MKGDKMFDFLKKKDDSPPDVGKEDEAEAQNVDSSFDNMASSGEEIPRKISPKGKKINRSISAVQEPEMTESVSLPTAQLGQPAFSDDRGSLELEKINARLEVINSFIKTFNERFSLVNQQIGEIRAMSINNEKDISLSNLDAKKVIEIVKEVNPEKLRIDYQKLDFRVNTLVEKLEANRQFVDSVVEEFKELKRKANLFEGTDALLKLNQDVQKDLIEIQKVNNRVRMNADKSEQIFIELSKGFQENQKVNEIITTLDNSYSVLRKEFEKISMDHKQVLNLEDFNDFKKKIESKLIIFDSTLPEIDKIKEENEKLSNAIERILAIEKKNEEEIAHLSLKGGTGNGGEYEQRLFSILELVDKMSLEINRIKNVGMKSSELEEQPILPRRKVERQIVNLPKLEVPEEKELQPLPEYETKEIAEENELTSSEKKDIAVERELNQVKKMSKRKIDNLLDEGKILLHKGDPAEAMKIYGRISTLYNSAEDENNLMYEKIIKFYDGILKAINSPAVIPPLKRNRGISEHHNKKIIHRIIRKKRTPEKRHTPEIKYSLATPARKFKKLSDY
jgi:hypothetical protein